MNQYPEPSELVPHAQGPAECLRCGRCWVAVWRVDDEPTHLECPTCGSPTPRPTRPMEGR